MDADLELAISRIEATGNFKVTRKVPRPAPSPRSAGPGERIGLIIDTETTGLDTEADELIEIGLVSFFYDEQDRITDVIGALSALREPTGSIGPAVQRLTGITNELVKGHHLDIKAIEKVVSSASVLIAHNAAFDRPVCERISPIFA